MGDSGDDEDKVSISKEEKMKNWEDENHMNEGSQLGASPGHEWRQRRWRREKTYIGGGDDETTYAGNNASDIIIIQITD